MNKPKKVFCVGMPRSGTRSLNVFMKSLGYPEGHFGYLRDKRKDIFLGDISQLDNVLWFCDSPAFALTEELIERYPEAKYIFTSRDPDSHAYSMLRLWGEENRGKFINEDWFTGVALLFWFVPLSEQRKNYQQLANIVKNINITDNDFKDIFKCASEYYQNKIRNVLKNSNTEWIEVDLKEDNKEKSKKISFFMGIDSKEEYPVINTKDPKYS